MKRMGIVFLLFAIALLAAPRPAVADAYVFESSVINTGSTTYTGGVYQRYYALEGPLVNNNCNGVCPNKPCTLLYGGDLVCKLNFKAAGNGYRGQADDIGNYPPATFANNNFNALYDSELGAGTSSHAGYYAWITGKVVNNATDLWSNAACTGTVNTSCLGNANNLAPIPVPAASGPISGTDTTLHYYGVQWASVSSGGADPGKPAQYNLYYYTADQTTDGTSWSCPTAPNETQFLAVPGSPHTSPYAVPLADVGAAGTTRRCTWFALRLVYPAFGGTKSSMFLSANSPPFTTTGAAVTMYDVRAKLVKQPGPKATVNVSWKVSNESGVDRYEVYRASMPTGPWTLVGTVNPGQSSYSFLDKTQSTGMALHSYYQVESINPESGNSKTMAVKVTK